MIYCSVLCGQETGVPHHAYINRKKKNILFMHALFRSPFFKTHTYPTGRAGHTNIYDAFCYSKITILKFISFS